jgi:hypothetical protein
VGVVGRTGAGKYDTLVLIVLINNLW